MTRFETRALAFVVSILALVGSARAQQACVVKQQTYQFCMSLGFGDQRDCACTDWSGNKVTGFKVDSKFIQHLIDGMDQGWIQQSQPNSEWLREWTRHQYIVPNQLIPPSKSPFWWNSEEQKQFYSFFAEEPPPPTATEPFPGIVPIGPWPTPPGWPPKQ